MILFFSFSAISIPFGFSSQDSNLFSILTLFLICMQTSLDIIGAKENLLGHSDAITCICACRPYSIVVTGSKDSLAIVWDLNRYAVFL